MAPCYEAMTDTTLSMYRRDTYTYWNADTLLFDKDHGITKYGWIDSVQFNYNPQYKGIALRIAGPYTVEHLGWHIDRKYDEEFIFYRNNSKAMEIASTCGDSLYKLLMNDIEGRLQMPKDMSVITPELMEKYGLPKDFGEKHPAWKQPSYKHKWNMMLMFLSRENNC